MTEAIVRLASEYGRYGYRRITALLRREGWHVNHKRVERIWRREGLKAQATQEWPAVAQRRIPYPSAAELAEPCLGL